MTSVTNASHENVSIKIARSEQRTTVLSALARIIANAYLDQTAADNGGSVRMTPRKRQSHFVNNKSKGTHSTYEGLP